MIDIRISQRIKSWARIGLTGAVVAGGIALTACTFGLCAQQPAQSFRPVRVLAAQPPITEFPVSPVRDALDDLNPEELVLGVVVGNEARAYPINMLTGPQREILNDRLGGKLIAATW